MDLRELIQRLQMDGRLYVKSTEEMTSVVEFLVLHECSVTISPSTDKRFLYRITYKDI